ncbi:MAG: phenylacetate--CoA ligase family protein [Hyphomicrobiaceae bacterium]
MKQNYFDYLDLDALNADYPIGPSFLESYAGMSADELRARQNERFLRIVAFGWKVPFYQRLWQEKGLAPEDIRSIDDLHVLPVYSKDDLMASVERFPPLGDFHGLSTYSADERPPVILQTTSGTTGVPQPLICGPKSREVQAMLLARLYAFQGVTSSDVIHSVYGHGMVNGGHYIRETVLHWVGATLLTAGTGVETRSTQQIQLMRSFGATVIVGFADYINHLSHVAQLANVVPGRDIPVRLISGHVGKVGRAALSDAWGGAAVYDWYGVGDTGAIAGEGPDQDGLYILEDAQLIELLDVDAGEPVVAGELGDIVCTCLYKDDLFPIIRFNTHDVTRLRSGDTNPFELPFRRMEGFLGRSDNMVKLRGVNIFPQAIGEIIGQNFAVATGEYLCRVSSKDGREEMVVVVETSDLGEELKRAIEMILRERLGIEIGVSLAPPGATAQATGLETRQKPIRLIDERSGEPE